jgi:hypothetical protein
MTSRPKLQRFQAAMKRIAQSEGFTDPNAALLWALSRIEAGVPIAQLWKIVQDEADEESVRGWAYTVLYSLAPDARQRVKEARKIGAHALIDEALEISDRPAATAAEAASNRLAVDTRFRLAGIFNREELGDSAPKVQMSISLGQLHLDALRLRNVAITSIPRIADASADYEMLPSGGDSDEE